MNFASDGLVLKVPSFGYVFTVSDPFPLIKVRVNSKLRVRHKKWFDTSLQELRNSLDYYSRQLSHDPFNKQLYNHCFKICEKYHRLRHKNRRNYFNGFMNKLDSLHENNPKLF